MTKAEWAKAQKAAEAFGRIGGQTRAANMTKEQRVNGARKAAKARWAKARAK